MDFAPKMRELLKRHGLSQADLAESIGTYQTQVSRWLESNTPPKWRYLLKIARVLDVSVDYLIDPAQDEPPRTGLPNDEAALLHQYRAMKVTGVIDEQRALAGLSLGAQLQHDPARVFTPLEGSTDITAHVTRKLGGGKPKRNGKEKGSGREADSNDEGTDPTGAPVRRR